MMAIKKALFLLTFSILFLCQTVYSMPAIRYEGYRDIWNLASYELLDEGRRQHYTDIIMAELDKYPDDFFERIGLSIIVITKDLKFDNVYRAAVPDNYSRIFFIGIRDDYTDDYLKHVFHHELNHYIEFSIWGDYRYNWGQWQILFAGRGGGGELAYQGGEDRTAILYNPNLAGFLNNYSTLGQEEDRSEMMAFFLTENGNWQFIEKEKRDNLFYQKAVLLFTFYKETLNFNLLDVFLLRVNQ
jgi:hypothetical protein